MNKTAVIVDDDPKVIELLEKTLSNLGFLVFSTENGKTALELLKREKPSLLISDLLIPGIHGSELCHEVQNTPELNHAKVILITSVYKESTIRLEMNCQSDGILAKPLSIRDLNSMIIRVMNLDPESGQVG